MEINKDFFKKINKPTILIILVLSTMIFYLYITKIKLNSIRESCAQEAEEINKTIDGYEFYYNKCLNSNGLKKEY